MSGAPIYTATADERRLATEWHGGMASMLYAVASTGALSRGTEDYRAGRTDEEWSADLLAELVREVAEVATLAAATVDEDGGYVIDAETAETWARNLAGVTIGETCHRCGSATGEACTLADRERVTYCPPCRAAMVLPCDCGGTFDRGRHGPPLCPDCGTICGYYDDDDLTDPDGEEVGA